jgi:hypothetical protein
MILKHAQHSICSAPCVSQVYTHFINKVSASSSTARQLNLAFAALNPSHSGSATRAELQAALRRMSTAPLDEERVDEILTELEDAKEGGKITVASFTAWMARRCRPALDPPMPLTASSRVALVTPHAVHSPCGANDKNMCNELETGHYFQHPHPPQVRVQPWRPICDPRLYGARAQPRGRVVAAGLQPVILQLSATALLCVAQMRQGSRVHSARVHLVRVHCRKRRSRSAEAPGLCYVYCSQTQGTD